MARRGLAFDQRDASSPSGERDRCGTACHSTTDDENFILQGIAPDSWMFHQSVTGLRISTCGGSLDSSMATGLWSARICNEPASGDGQAAAVSLRLVVSSFQLSPRSTRTMEARVKAMTPTADSTSPRWLQ